MNNLRKSAKTLFLIVLSVALCYFLFTSDFLDFTQLERVVDEGLYWLLLAAFFQISMLFFSILRFFHILRNSRVNVLLSHATVSSLVGMGVGQLLPASQAVTDLVRIGILFGWHEPTMTARLRIVAISLVEKYLSYVAMLLGGTTGLVAVLFVAEEMIGNLVMFAWVTGFAFALGLVAAIGYSATYWIHRWNAPKRLLSWLRSFGGHRYLPQSIADLLYVEKVKAFAYPPGVLITQLVLSLLVLLSSSLVYYYCALAADLQIPLIAIFSVMPLLALATFLPLGIGGLGGQQFVAIGFFAIFALDAPAVATTSLIANLLVILVQLTLGGGSVLLFWHQIKSLYRHKVANSVSSD